MGRKSKGKKLKKKIMIYCEGYTEVQYFEMLKNKHSSNTVNTKRIGIKSKVMSKKDPKGIVSEAISQLTFDNQKYDIDQSYVIFDKDDATDSEVQEAFEMATSHGIVPIFSNECFDLWLLMHYQKVSGSIPRKQVYRLLSTFMNVKSYEDLKADNLSSYIEDRVIHAIDAANSNVNMAVNISRKAPSNPYTNIHFHLKDIMQVSKL